jgi:hypothetical protein
VAGTAGYCFGNLNIPGITVYCRVPETVVFGNAQCVVVGKVHDQ